MVYIVMGVIGAGKTTIGRLLAKRLGIEFRDADDYHTECNIKKMRDGIPLTDEDRKPWIFAIRSVIDAQLALGKDCVIACSALKDKYRKTLIQERKEIILVYLKGDIDIIRERIKSRTGHFASTALLENQFEVLEEPENALVVDIRKTPDEIVDEILKITE
ncbi:MAG TPA: gluconokinase [Candidatus Goldiibacteriota bacterium]|nr:gluconokinase [Candidatus Goldiibacteriota bacterium]